MSKKSIEKRQKSISKNKVSTKSSSSVSKSTKKAVNKADKKSSMAKVVSNELRTYLKSFKKYLKTKKRLHFVGRFGKRAVRRKSKEKWNRWRKPRGIDIVWNREDGKYPKIGFKRPSDVRGVHPSGLKEVYIASKKDLESLISKIKTRDGLARIGIRIASRIGQKKKSELIQEADKYGLRVFNR